MKRSVLFVLIIVSFFSYRAIANDDIKNIRVVTEETPPFIFFGSSNEPTGSLVKTVNKILAILGNKNKIEILPWARAYDMAEKNENVMIFPMGKTSERNGLFKYAGEIINIKTYIYKLKKRTDIKVRNLADAKKYSIGVIRQDVRYKFLIENQFELLDESADSETIIRKFIAGRTDLVIGTELSLKSNLEKLRENPNNVEKILYVKDLDGRRYLAFSKKTSDEVIAAVKAAALKVYKPE